MFGWFRILQRSGGLLTAIAVLLGAAFYGIAQISMIVVDDPSRGLRILGVFLVLSAIFCALLAWLVRRVVQRILWPVISAREFTSRISGLGGAGGRAAYHALRQNTRYFGGFARTIMRATVRAVGTAFRFSPRKRGVPARRTAHPGGGASVIPFRSVSRVAEEGSRQKELG
ncbi:MAG: hypothetical protein O2807_11845 [bacterium]|nr:hypothetical protein [bacterium]